MCEGNELQNTVSEELAVFAWVQGFGLHFFPLSVYGEQQENTPFAS
jgi:hypothetical protein